MSDEDPHKRMRRFGELCGYFYGRRFFGLETIMSDRDSDHMLLELQEALAEIDLLRKLLRWHKWPEEKPEKEGDYFCVDSERCFVGCFKDGSWAENYGPDELLAKVQYWRPIGPLPGGE